MTGKEALVAYGYVQGPDGEYIQAGRGSDTWSETEGGWLRKNRGTPQPYTVIEGEEGKDISNPDHAGSFNWVWPDEELARIYEHATDQKAKGWPATGEAHHVDTVSEAAAAEEAPKPTQLPAEPPPGRASKN